MADSHIRSAAQPTITSGVVGGLIGGVVYAIVVHLVVIALFGTGAIFVPERQIAAVVLGAGALSPDYDLIKAVGVGTGVHFAVSAMYGALYALIAQLFGLRSSLSLIVGGIVFGLAIYAANLFVIFPKWFPWFLANDPMIQATLHALTFGAVIGYWTGRPTTA